MKWKEVEKNIKKSNSRDSYRRIDFEVHTSIKPHTPSTTIQNSSTITFDKSNKNNNNTLVKSVNTVHDDSISGPIPGLCNPHSIYPYITWKSIPRNAPGLFNQGNTCYLNSTLQCLLHIPILSQFLLINNNNSCNNTRQSSILNMYEKFVKEIWINNTNSKSISPRGIVQNIRRIGKHLRPMRQEDAHEFLRLFLDCIHEEILKSKGLQSNLLKYGNIINTTLISRIFGGYLRNELTCSKCKYQSRSYNHFHDLCLDIQYNVSNIMHSFNIFTKPEVLGRGNEWFCEKCKMKVKATKQMTIARGPMVLVLQLKRFSYGNSGGKISKQISFPIQLTIPLTDDTRTSQAKYELCGVVVHHGTSVHSGHYIAYVKSPCGQWCEMNDCNVSIVSVQYVLGVQAYMLFYTRSDITPILPIPSSLPSPISSPLSHTLHTTHANSVHTLNVSHTSPCTTSTLNTSSLMKSKVGEISIVTEIHPVKRLQYDDCARLPRILSLFLQPMRFRGAVFWTWRNKRGSLRLYKSSEKCVKSINYHENDHEKDIENDHGCSGKEEGKKEVNLKVEDGSHVHDTPELSNTMTRLLLNMSKRSRDVDGEGVWEGVSAKVFSERSRVVNGRATRKDQQQKVWHRELDQGRLKKVNGKKDDSALFSEQKNVFQEVHNNNGHKKAYMPSW